MNEQEMKIAGMPETFDIAILGGGIAGLTLALQIKQARPQTSILVVEKQEHPVPESAHKVGESTVEIQAYYLRNVLGLGEHLRTQQLPKYGLRLFFTQEENRDIARRVELGHAVLPPRVVATYQLDRGRLENELGIVIRQAGVTFWDGSKVQQIDLQPASEFHRVSIQQASGPREIQARWLVDGSGRNTLLQRQLGLAKKVGHHANAVWFRLGYRVDVSTWSHDEKWQMRIREGERYLSTNHLLGAGYWVWIIPLASGSTSIGIVSDPTLHNFDGLNRFERALDWLRKYEPQCAADIESHQDTLQDFRVMKNYSYGCEQVFSDERWCLIGEAGVSLDPLYSPGGDLMAIANGLAGDLIINALDGEDVEDRAAIHNQLFLLFANSWLSTYEHQYPLMGNAQIMVAKVIWDTAVYWAVPGLLYFHDKIRRIADSPALILQLARFSVLSEHVQAFFRDWLELAHPGDADIFIKYYDFDFMAQLHIGMTAGLSDEELEQQFTKNVRFLEQLAGQLVSVVSESFAQAGHSTKIQAKLQSWQEDEYLRNLVAIYQEDSRERPLDGGWITLGRQPAYQYQEIAE
ncbi:MAG TPA: tryptophan 7-halogenase [Ktedonobacteraceae bacterium]|nr:tryptophan 7-halogenase [Ktedonobacteraceae bacterium]